ncbi:unnamed protein product [Linum tenue]|uniref:Potassium channel domain-containing protein n=1 Tax=Linum tenue TaxID=586396 RepID=A0AAV0GMW7_9ROSI|nr:unnamed protein product [Linum tenue]
MASKDNNDAERPLLSDATLQRRARSIQPINQKSDHSPIIEKKSDHNPQQQESNGNQNQWLDSLLGIQSLKFNLVFILLILYLGLGTLTFSLIMNQIDGKQTNPVLDALYFCVVTMTTVGYGDLVPRTFLAKLLASIYAFTGMAMVGIVLSKAADYLMEKQETVLAKAFHSRTGAHEIMKEVEAHKHEYKALFAAAIMIVLMVFGTIMLCSVEGMDVVDAIYCVCSTVTTLGYGDRSFSTWGGRLFAVVWILSSTICLAQLFLYVAEWYTDKRKRLLVEWVIARNVTSSDLEAADIDHDDVVSTSEFIVFTLKEMGRIDDGDIALAMERLKRVDVDRSGTLTKADLVTSSVAR